MTTHNALVALDVLHATLAKAHAFCAMLEDVSQDVVSAREAGLLDDEDMRFLAPHAAAVGAAHRARSLLTMVNAEVEAEPCLMGLSHNLAAMDSAAAALSLAKVLMGDAREWSDSAGPEDHL